MGFISKEKKFMLTDTRVKERLKMATKEEKDMDIIVTKKEEKPVLNLHPREMYLVEGESGTLNVSFR